MMTMKNTTPSNRNSVLFSSQCNTYHMFYKFSFNRMRNVVSSGNESSGMSAVCVFKSTIHVIYIVFDAQYDTWTCYESTVRECEGDGNAGVGEGEVWLW